MFGCDFRRLIIMSVVQSLDVDFALECFLTWTLLTRLGVLLLLLLSFNVGVLKKELQD